MREISAEKNTWQTVKGFESFKDENEKRGMCIWVTLN